MCDMKGVAPSDGPTDNYHPTLQFPSVLWSFLASFAVLVHSLCSHQRCFQQQQQAAVFGKKRSDKPTVDHLPSIKRQTDKVSDWLV